MRRAAKTDDNHKEILDAFRKFGCSVFSLHQVGQGFPDAIIAKYHRNILVEIKDGKKPLSKRKLTDDQIDFHKDWQGPIAIVKSLDDVVNVMKLYFHE